ncbi:MAG: NADH-quinone oxidoreductase subunit N [Candidatus Acidiferrales bacterium]
MSPVPWPAISAQARVDFAFVLPEILLALFGLLTLLLDLTLDEEQKSWNALPALVGLALSGGALAMLGFGPQTTSAFGNSISIGPFSGYFGLLALMLAVLLVLLSAHTDHSAGEQSGERYALVLLATAGLMLLACGNDLVVLFVAFETVSVSLYALANTADADRGSREGTLRFLLAGAFSTALVAYGFSLLYGLGGSTNLAVISARMGELSQISSAQNLLIGMALAAVGGGILLRIAGVPLHSGMPEVGERAPAAVAAFISVAGKLACFTLLLRLLFSIFWRERHDWALLLMAAALVAMTIGTIASLRQINIKRLLAYSAIAQAGYVLLAIGASVNRDGSFNVRGLGSAGYYLLAFVIFQLGAFALVIVLRQREAPGDELASLNGLLRKHPAAGAAMIFLLLSCVGVPPTAGFIAKLEVVRVLFANQHAALAWIAVIFAIPPVYPSYRIIRSMGRVRGAGAVGGSERTPLSDLQVVALAAMVILTLLLGVLPAPFEHFVAQSLAALALR